ncbi:MAG: tRNA (adenosine(37)-N6)-threonylcarbamoyltransferase complex dimerization subunit type 1 TsaB [Deltaproteobacteria bacterium]|jgi:tRNA threonylcarbamoyladenosine biosynthesis protein TsaB|nr:tRNA (adenosine(37)-N6)-threonylcarbamoyltransferase complex dimerization subunit type 1 TsaB [Deltaproteobacteria bacterium]MBW2496474.1 tRNA (adenosine(37)-N6)-threonylcarbamoyltransferase complex dimerization subunit type 1 TsaB [Deltaproteobacteria bacterium]
MARILLAIESATEWLSVALLEDERLLELRRAEGTRQHATALLPTIATLLGDAGLGLERVEGLAVSAGPGSFTSLRIALATAKGLAFRRSLPALGVSTLEAMALSALEGAEVESPARREAFAMLDARRGEWYAGGWCWSSEGRGVPEPTLAEGLYAPSRLADALAAGALVVAPEPMEWLEAGIGEDLSLAGVITGEAGRPSAEWVGRLAQRRLARGEGGTAAALLARYVRRAQAEAQRLGGPVEAGSVAAVEGSDGGR